MRTLSLLLVTAFVAMAAPPERWQELTAEQVAAIDKAASQVTLRVKPAKPAKLLMATYAQGFWHRSIPYGAKALELIGQKTGAFTITRAEDPSAFTAANLASFDAIVVNNVTGIDRWITDDVSRKAFVEFVHEGGGLFANHSASDGGWKEYNDLLGGRFAGHPWGAGGTWGFQVEDPQNLLAAAFNQQQFTLADEIYMLRDHFSRDTHRVLVSLDLSHADTDAAQAKGSRPDRDYPVTLIRRFGEGRVFYSVFGHREDIHSNPTLLQHYTDGLQYALGHLKIDDSPTALWERLARYQVGRSHEVEQKVLATLSPEIEPRFHEILSGDSTTDAKIFVLDHLPRVWSAASIRALAPLVSDDALSSRAIEALRHATANFAKDRSGLNKTLRDALLKAKDPARIPILNALGYEQDSTAIHAIAPFANAANARVADAAILALGEIGSSDALPILQKLKQTSKVQDALLRIAEQTSNAAIYSSLVEVRPAAAFQGLARVQGAKAIPTLAKAQSVAAINALARIPGQEAEDALAGISADSSAQQLALVTAWRSRGGATARRELLALTRSDNELVVSEAFRALGAVGEIADLPVLIAGLQRKDKTADIAKDVLVNFGKPGTDDGLIAAIEQGGEIAEILGERRSKKAAPALMRARLSEDSGIARAAWKALANCATPAQLAELIGSLSQVDTRAGDRLGDVLLALKDALDDKALAAAIPSATDAGRSVALEVLGKLQTPIALATLRAYIAESAALKALAGWQSAQPLPDLLETAKSATEKSTQILAMRAYAEILSRVPDLEAFRQGFAASKHPESTVDLLKAIANAAEAPAAELAAAYLSDESANIAASAWRAVTQIHNLSGAGKWRFAASHSKAPFELMRDGKPETRWTTGEPKKPGMWVSIDFGSPMPIRQVVLDNTNPERQSQGDIPQQASLQVSDDGESWTALPSTFESGPVSTFTADGHARHLKINFEGEAQGLYWSIHELYINDKAKVSKERLILAEAMAISASEHGKQASKAIDSDARSAWQSDSGLSGDEWLEVSFAEPRRVSRAVIDSTQKKDDFPKTYALQVSLDGERWSPQLLADKGSTKIDLSTYPAPIRKLRVLQTARDNNRRWSVCELQLWEMGQ